ncbi:MAG: hypothetical protein IPL78_20195 [Chloroflexi bacterium]|nr:hypothetical protein [Chloroflexota bacterium]
MYKEEENDLRKLQQQMVETFDMDELRTLFFTLAVNWDEIPGRRISSRIRELIIYLGNRGRLTELRDLLVKERPQETWPDVPAVPHHQPKAVGVAFPELPFYKQSWFTGLSATLVLIGIFALLIFQFQLPQQIINHLILPFPPAKEGEALIIIATFHHSEGVVDVAAHDEIRRAIQEHINKLNLENVRVAVEPTVIESINRKQAEALGNRYNATLIIWGSDTGIRLEINFLNIKEPDFDAANANISETAKTQLANPEAYSQFVINELPGQLTYLSLFALGQTEYSQENYGQAIKLIETAVAALPNLTEMDRYSLELEAAYFRLGWLYQVIGQLPAAFDQAIALSRGIGRAFNNRGLECLSAREIMRRPSLILTRPLPSTRNMPQRSTIAAMLTPTREIMRRPSLIMTRPLPSPGICRSVQ